jgi:hypothetical protein
MIGEFRIRDVAVIGSLLVTGLAGSTIALAHRGGDAQFIQDQLHPPALSPAEVERVVRSAPDPLVGKGSGVSATCEREGSGQLGNPWGCVVSYKSGRQGRLTVHVNQDGTYTGRYAGGGGVNGCCIDTPGAR